MTEASTASLEYAFETRKNPVVATANANRNAVTSV